MSDGTREAQAAAKWWAERIAGDDDIRTGDAMNDSFATAARDMVKTPDAEQVETFRIHLERGILAEVVTSGSWQNAVEKGDPQWGSVMRTIAVDYGPDPILAEAIEAAGISRLRLPMKTVMWVNPGSVAVSHGHGVAEVELGLP